MKIYLTAIVKPKPEKTALLKSILQQMVVDSRKEPACLQYDLFQSEEDVFIFQEIWADQAGLDLHNKQVHLENFKSQAAGLTIEPLIVYKNEKLADDKKN